MSPVRIERFERIDSTNLHARRALESGTLNPDDGPVLYLADEQTGGVGRFGRAWSSPRGGLWMTLLHPLPGGAATVGEGLGLRVGAACLAAVLDATEGSPRAALVRLKWPNDVLIGGRKVLGVLTEVVQRARATWVLIGVGVNANFPAAALPGVFRRPPTTLLDELGRPTDLDALRDNLCTRLCSALATPDLTAALALARPRLHGLGEPASFCLPGGEEIRGTLSGLSDSGLPTIRTADGEMAAPPGADLLCHTAPLSGGSAE